MIAHGLQPIWPIADTRCWILDPHRPGRHCRASVKSSLIGVHVASTETPLRQLACSVLFSAQRGGRSGEGIWGHGQGILGRTIFRVRWKIDFKAFVGDKRGDVPRFHAEIVQGFRQSSRGRHSACKYTVSYSSIVSQSLRLYYFRAAFYIYAVL